MAQQVGKSPITRVVTVKFQTTRDKEKTLKTTGEKISWVPSKGSRIKMTLDFLKQHGMLENNRALTAHNSEFYTELNAQ